MYVLIECCFVIVTANICSLRKVDSVDYSCSTMTLEILLTERPLKKIYIYIQAGL